MEAKRNPSVVIIGAGMTGILMTIKLREAGITDITLLEKSDRIGGTWRENTYPGVACDVPSHMYTYSFEPNPEWSNVFARGHEIQQYFQKVADKYGVSEKVRLNEAVISSVYKDGKWTVKTSKGDTIVADFVVSATGILHHPAKPDIPGIDTYAGTMFHTAEWDHSIDLRGKRIGVIGTGSTAAQVIPELVDMGAEVSVFQRTPQWIFKIPDGLYSEKMKERFRQNPNMMNRRRVWFTRSLEHIFTKAVIGRKVQRKIMEWGCKLNLRFSVKDPELRNKLTPDYQVGCKRLIINNTFYKAIQKPNAHLITEGIERIDETGIHTKDGQHHELDVIVLSTGFDPTAYMRPMNLVGKEDLNIDDAWRHKVRAYRSLMVPNYPNFFLMLGPNTPIGNFSVIAMSEVQSQYIIKLINRWRENLFDEVEATETAVDRFMAYIKAGLSSTVWVGGCKSWYLDADGDPILWPYTWGKWVKEMAEPNLADLSTRRVVAAPAIAAETQPMARGKKRKETVTAE
ncbi:NAD(P)/FAD-dependent oxidoreductase [Pseudomaricurvus alkylphenolicus]|uniref:flavin-containing monooxygenase n=1 Tax=Pseudomaricurvus alkylphenolicus TaxID=1306991 RepID=UPI001421D909|nr:NAD(P)/FAD-dependent oxidoreductase [Pseudomaricurvus alkylphenolicus]NIB44163.1 NAD(P)/FAD-dependent oxidoreductase [Pseudomaricurvus alkylphenolicus]